MGAAAMTSQSEMLTAEQRTPKTPITIDINQIRKEVEAICGKRIAIWLKKLPAALNRSRIENEIRWVEQIRCKWLETDWLDRMTKATDAKQCNRCERPAEPSHSCPYQCEITGNEDSEYCNCCSECEAQCRDDI